MRRVERRSNLRDNGRMIQNVVCSTLCFKQLGCWAAKWQTFSIRNLGYASRTWRLHIQGLYSSQICYFVVGIINAVVGGNIPWWTTAAQILESLCQNRSATKGNKFLKPTLRMINANCRAGRREMVHTSLPYCEDIPTNRKLVLQWWFCSWTSE